MSSMEQTINRDLSNEISNINVHFPPYNGFYEKCKIIDGKKYDVDNSELLVSSDNGEDPLSGNYYVFKALFKCKTRGYFLYTVTHGSDEFGVNLLDRIKVTFKPFRTKGEARVYCERFLAGSVYEMIFGRMEK